MSKLKANDFFETEGSGIINFGFVHGIKVISEEEHYSVTWKNFPNQIFNYKVSEVDQFWGKSQTTFPLLKKDVEKTQVLQNCDHQGFMKKYRGFSEDYSYCENCNYKKYDL